jgi:IclR family transcriptional regulator, acetate operon repressor
VERAAERNIPDIAVARVSAVLGAFDARHPRLRVSEISRRAGLPMSTTSRLVAELVSYGFLERSGAILSVGGRLGELGELAAARRDLRAVALPHLADLRAATRQTAHLTVLNGAAVVHLATVRGTDAPDLPPGPPAYACAAGKVLLAFGGPAAVELVCSRPLRLCGPRTVAEQGVLRRQLARIRECGLAYESEESGPGIGAVAAVVLRSDGVPAAAVAVSGWVGRLNPRVLGPAVRTVALAIGRELGPAGR